MSLDPYVHDTPDYAAAVGWRLPQVERAIDAAAPGKGGSWQDAAPELDRLGTLHAGYAAEVRAHDDRTDRLRDLVAGTDAGDGGSRGTPKPPAMAADEPEIPHQPTGSGAPRPSAVPAASVPPATSVPPAVAVSRILTALADVAEELWAASPDSPDLPGPLDRRDDLLDRDDLTRRRGDLLDRRDDLLDQLDSAAVSLPAGVAPPTPYTRPLAGQREVATWKPAVAAAVDGTPDPEPGSPAARDLDRLRDRLDRLDDLGQRFDAAHHARTALLQRGAEPPPERIDAPGLGDVRAVTDHLFDGTPLPSMPPVTPSLDSPGITDAPEGAGIEADDPRAAFLPQGGSPAEDTPPRSSAQDPALSGPEPRPFTSMVNAGDPFAENAAQVPPFVGTYRGNDGAERDVTYHDIVVHSDGYSLSKAPTSRSALEVDPGALDKINSAAARYPVSHLIKEIRADSSYRGGPIRLVACHGSAPWSEIAATLADALGVPVLGATTAVIPTPGRRLGDPWTHVLEDPDGTVGIWLEHQPRTRPEGWRIITDGLGALSPA
ncbi:MAG: hypothetical protein ACRCZD_19120, partial [Phycicoccus sp.]